MWIWRQALRKRRSGATLAAETKKYTTPRAPVAGDSYFAWLRMIKFSRLMPAAFPDLETGTQGLRICFGNVLENFQWIVTDRLARHRQHSEQPIGDTDVPSVCGPVPISKLFL